MPERSFDSVAPVVSIIVLSYNHQRFILESLNSIRAQTYQNYELIIIDDCSSDDSVALIEGWIVDHGRPVTFIVHDHNQGICGSMNEALALVQGEYITANASDDVWMPEKLERQVKEMEAAPVTTGVLYSDAYLIDEEGQRLPGMFIARQRHFDRPPQGRIFAELLVDNFIPAMTFMMRRQCLETVGLFDEDITYEDWDYWLRASQVCDFMYSPYVSAAYRLVAGSASSKITTRVIQDRVRVLVKPWRSDRHTDRLIRRRLRVAVSQLFARDDPDRLEFIRLALRRDPSLPGFVLYGLARLGVKGAYVRGVGRRVAMALRFS